MRTSKYNQHAAHQLRKAKRRLARLSQLIDDHERHIEDLKVLQQKVDVLEKAVPKPEEQPAAEI